MTYAEARAKADQMMDGANNAVCLVVDADGGWEAMWFSEWIDSRIPHERVGWVSSNSKEANEVSFAQAVRWMEAQR